MHKVIFASIILVITVILFTIIPLTLGLHCSAGGWAAESMVNHTRRVYLHYVDWCPHCKIMWPVWAAAKKATAGSGIIYAEINEDKVKTPGISSYPTIMMVDENGRRHQYMGGPDFTTLRDWIVSPVL